MVATDAAIEITEHQGKKLLPKARLSSPPKTESPLTYLGKTLEPNRPEESRAALGRLTILKTIKAIKQKP